MNVMVFTCQKTLMGWFACLCLQCVIFTFRRCVDVLSLQQLFMCKYQKTCRVVQRVCKVSIPKSSGRVIFSCVNRLLCQMYVVTAGKPLLSAFVFQWNELKNIQACVHIFFLFMRFINYWSHRVTFFSPMKLTFFFSFSLSSNTPIFCFSIFLFHWMFQAAEMPTWNPEPQAQLNKELNSWVLL